MSEETGNEIDPAIIHEAFKTLDLINRLEKIVDYLEEPVQGVVQEFIDNNGQFAPEDNNAIGIHIEEQTIEQLKDMLVNGELMPERLREVMGDEAFHDVLGVVSEYIVQKHDELQDIHEENQANYEALPDEVKEALEEWRLKQQLKGLDLSEPSGVELPPEIAENMKKFFEDKLDTFDGDPSLAEETAKLSEIEISPELKEELMAALKDKEINPEEPQLSAGSAPGTTMV